MSPVAFHNFRSTQTRLDLNGPTIAISENPTDVVTQAVGVTVLWVWLEQLELPHS